MNGHLVACDEQDDSAALTGFQALWQLLRPLKAERVYSYCASVCAQYALSMVALSIAPRCRRYSLMRAMNSARVEAPRWKTPRMALVTVWLPGFLMPLIVIQR